MLGGGSSQHEELYSRVRAFGRLRTTTLYYIENKMLMPWSIAVIKHTLKTDQGQNLPNRYCTLIGLPYKRIPFSKAMA